VLATLIIASIGAATGITSLVWNIVSSQRQGPVIKISATCSGRGEEMKVSGTIRNAGRFPANLDAMTFEWPTAASQSYGGGGTRIRSAIPPANIEGIEIPGPMPAESGSEFTISGIDKIDIGLSIALHDRRGVVLRVQTAAGKRAKKSIKYAKLFMRTRIVHGVWRPVPP
jgi:hypothetical protein